MKRFSVVLSTVFLLSCEKLDNHMTIVGIWFSCDNGDYTEAYVDDKYFTGLSSSGGSGGIWAYEVRGDSVFYDVHDIDDEIKINWSRIQVISKDHIRMNSYDKAKKAESEFSDFYRLDELDQKVDVMKFADSTALVLLKEEFLKRSKSKKCK